MLATDMTVRITQKLGIDVGFAIAFGFMYLSSLLAVWVEDPANKIIKEIIEDNRKQNEEILLKQDETNELLYQILDTI